MHKSKKANPGVLANFHTQVLIVPIEAGMVIGLWIVIVIVAQSFTATPSRSKTMIGM